MRLHPLTLITCASLLALTFTGCGGKGVRVTEGNQNFTAPPVVNRNAPMIVHLDLFERLVTIRNGAALGDQFLIATNYAGAETGVLKARPLRIGSPLLTADILEGAPQINDTISTADAARSVELSKVYRDLGEDN
ncbi:MULTISPECIES: hypothetical protein [unclassified Lentimonas]|uniref:hypothetical protein n=1 Tax=unclassified Lentimonas TaxID=2630993 RepID=UPI00132AF6FC|nr:MULTISPECIES: hypothetical protein [unclassified Lentimonas]CAA6677061.1 Unannotated [Lentimonas sp. CC4]CAA6687255.1 Unannotated [Lentimonas sp. CC6]CAA6692332.1 Unannotated [Lentimonas sp. CC10]CAA6694666.1 Unannotated [Lentimonas sp. CC19]CAA7071415.1 Unannotated [Lentimonas sp. CC11]